MKSVTTTIVTVTLAIGLAGVAFATDEVTSLSYISYLERYASVRPAQQEEIVEAIVNMPIVPGDRLETSRGARLELQLADGCTVWLDQFTVLDVDAVVGSQAGTASRTSLFLAQGEAAIEIPATALGDESVQLASELGTAMLDKPGLYRIGVGTDALELEAHAGNVELPIELGSVLVRAGQRAWRDGRGRVDTGPLPARFDDFWAWVEARRRAADTGTSTEHVAGTVAHRAFVLDSYGEWVYVTSYSSWMWRPRVAVGWVPFSYGRWYWTPVGWAWISYEPWGWLPYHYGTWYWDVSFGWVWGWDPIWSPAWVHWFYYPGYIGWCPRGYYDGWYYHHCRDCRHHGGGEPLRWGSAALDFSGRVRLGAVDPRPWTFVRSDNFASGRLERMRIDPNNLLRDVPGNPFAHVRSGPLVTPPPTRGATGRLIEASLQVEARELPDLSTIMGRDGNATSRLATLPVRTVRTADLQLPGRYGGAGGGSQPPSVRQLPGTGRTAPGATAGSGGLAPRSLPTTTSPGNRGTSRTPTHTVPNLPTGRVPSGTVSRPATPETPQTPARPIPPRTVRTQPAPTGQTPGGRPAPPPPNRTTPNVSRPEVGTPSRPPHTPQSTGPSRHTLPADPPHYRTPDMQRSSPPHDSPIARTAPTGPSYRTQQPWLRQQPLTSSRGPVPRVISNVSAAPSLGVPSAPSGSRPSPRGVARTSGHSVVQIAPSRPRREDR
ncbi:MAG: hypothetical protein HXY19_05675 [Thermoanaerobaculaceae bacterium]|nr:hypothetical protein [Thermoanaerobaculaceae bacterium]